MIKKNLCITIVHLENKLEEAQVDLKSCDDRTKVVVEVRAGKLVLDTTELVQAIELVREFGINNPTGEQVLTDNAIMQVEHVDSYEDI